MKTIKGATTKAAILESARQHFGKSGYARATIRAIAADTNVDPALVIRYFGDKESLFIASTQFDLRLPDLAAATRGQVARVIVAHFLMRWEEDDTLMALLRVACTNARAVDQLQAIFRGQVLPLIMQLRPDDKDQAVRAGFVASQMLGIGLCRYILQLPPLAMMDRSLLIDWIAPTIDRYIFDTCPDDTPGKAGAAEGRFQDT